MRSAAARPWSTPAPDSVLQPRPWPLPAHRDFDAEQDAADVLWATDLRPLPTTAIQWRTPGAAAGFEDLWCLPEEAHWGDFFAEQVPKLQALGWVVAVQPGFAHFSVPVQRWRLVVDPATARSRRARTGRAAGRASAAAVGDAPIRRGRARGCSAWGSRSKVNCSIWRRCWPI